MIQWFGQRWNLSAFNASFLCNFRLVKRLKFGSFRALWLWKEWPQIWHTALPWLQFLEINHIWHSTTVQVCGVKLSIHYFWVGDEIIEIYVLFLEWMTCRLCLLQHYPRRLSLYSRVERKRQIFYTYHTWQQSYSLYAYLSAGDRLCVSKNYPPKLIVINACNHRQCWKSKWCNHRQGHIFLLPLLHRMGLK